jgi:membrane dipeptidase
VGLGVLAEERLPVVDLHEDISFYFMSMGAGQPYGDFDEDLEGRQADIPKYRRGNVRLVFAAMFPEVDVYGVRGSHALYGFKPKPPVEPSPGASRLLLLEHLRTYYSLAEFHGIEIVESAGEAERLLASREWRLGFILHLEGADALVDTIDLKLLVRLGVRSLGLTWNHDNRWGASAATSRDYGLTAEGEELVREANRLGVIIDVAHASPRTALEAIEASKKPVMDSHTGITSWVDTPRNITAEILEALARNDGVMGVTLITPIIFGKGEDPTLDALASKIASLVEVYGSRVVAIGTDFHGLLRIKPPKGFESIDRVQALLDKLAELGLGDNDLRRIAYENALRVIKANLPP